MLGKYLNTTKLSLQALLMMTILLISLNASSCRCTPPVNPHAVASQLKFAKLECDAAKGIVIYNIKNDAKEAATGIQLRYTNNSSKDVSKTVVINNKLTDTVNIKTIPAGGSTGDQALPIDFKLADEAKFNFEILCDGILHVTPGLKTFYDKLPQLKLVTVGPTSLVGYDSEIEFKIQKEVNSGNIDLSKLSLKVLCKSKELFIVNTSLMDMSGEKLRSAVEGGNIKFPLSHLKPLKVVQALLVIQLEYGSNQLDKAEFSWRMPLNDPITEIFMAVIQQNEEWMKELLKTPGIDINIENEQGETVLHKAVELGSQEQVDFLLKFENINVNCKNKEYKQTPLHKAVKQGNQEIIDSLLAKGADINAKDYLENTPLHIAAIEGNEETIQKLLSNSNIDINAKNQDGHTPLGLAARNGDVAIMNILLNNHAAIRIDKNGNTLLHKAVRSGVKDAIQLLLDTKKIDINAENVYRETLLSIAIKEANLEIIKFLLNQPEILINNYINDAGTTTLHMLAARAYLFNKVGEAAAAMEALINKGADVNAKTSGGNSPLHLAAKEGGQADINILLNYGAEINDKNKRGVTPLHIAIDSRNEAAVKALLSSPKIDLNIQDIDGFTPLYTAVLNLQEGEDLAREKSIIEMLLKKGARTDIKNKVGETVLDLVKELKDPETEQLFGIAS